MGEIPNLCTVVCSYFNVFFFNNYDIQLLLTLHSYLDFNVVMSNLMNDKNRVGFSTQSLVTFSESNVGGRSTKKNEIPEFHNLSSILSIERNEFGQIYVQDDLASAGHCSVNTKSLFGSGKGTS